MEKKDEKIACFKKLAEQRQTEINEKKKHLQATEANIERIEKENEALLKEFERGVVDLSLIHI